jgi:S1-C subfamily serine protease
VVLNVVHDGHVAQVVVPVEERHDNLDILADRASQDGSRIPRLGALGIDVDGDVLSTLEDVRLPSGVLITAREEQESASENSLVAGDIIHAVNGKMVSGLADLRSALDQVPPDSAVALQVERDGKLRFLAFR